jgi:3-hydroxybutyryl-CoA dehydrogenase
MDIRQVSIIGGGFMGAGIAQATARGGFAVTVYEPTTELGQKSRERIEQSVAKARARGKLSEKDAEQVLGKITITDRFDAVADSDLVIEAVPEDEKLKQRIFRELSFHTGPQTLLASNTSSIPIAQLAGVTKHPERVLGMHFFSPVPVMALVELVKAIDTSDATIKQAQEFVNAISKHPILTKDRSGFIVNMLLVPYLMASVRMYEQQFATREAIDEGMRLGCGHPMGPLQLCDFIGLDVLYAVCASLYEEFKQAEYAPPPLLKRMVVAGHHGRKTGRGFYEYK